MHYVRLIPSLQELQEALRIRREIEALEDRFARLVSGKKLPHPPRRLKLTGHNLLASVAPTVRLGGRQL